MPEPPTTPTREHWQQAIADIDAELLDVYPAPSSGERAVLVEERAHRLAAADPLPPVESADLVTLGNAMATLIYAFTSSAFLGEEVPNAILLEARDRARAWQAEIAVRQNRVGTGAADV